MAQDLREDMKIEEILTRQVVTTTTPIVITETINLPMDREIRTHHQDLKGIKNEITTGLIRLRMKGANPINHQNSDRLDHLVTEVTIETFTFVLARRDHTHQSRKAIEEGMITEKDRTEQISMVQRLAHQVIGINQAHTGIQGMIITVINQK